MKKKERKFVYISNLDYSGTVFQTQILDWLYQFQGKGLDFDLIQAFHIKSISNPGFLRKQLKGLKSNSHFYAGSVYLLPSKSFFHIINSLIIYTKLLKYLFSYNEILIFSRAIIGKEISLLRKISPVSIILSSHEE